MRVTEPLRPLYTALSLTALTGLAIAVVPARRQRDSVARVDQLTYPEVVAYFVENQPDAQEALRGALLRHKCGRVWLVSFRYVNESGSMHLRHDGSEYGQQLRVGRLDEELNDVFGDKDLIVFQ